MEPRDKILYDRKSANADLISLIENHRGALKVQTLAELLDTSKKYVYSQIKRGELPAFRIGWDLRLNPADVVAWLRARTTVSVSQSRLRGAA